jgi:hypothetical protein
MDVAVRLDADEDADVDDHRHLGLSEQREHAVAEVQIARRAVGVALVELVDGFGLNPVTLRANNSETSTSREFRP